MAWREIMRQSAHERGVDLAQAVHVRRHPHTREELVQMLAGERPETQEGMLAILNAVAPVVGPHALADASLRSTAMPDILRLPHARRTRQQEQDAMPLALPVPITPRPKTERKATIHKSPALSVKVRREQMRDAAMIWMNTPVTTDEHFTDGLDYALDSIGKTKIDVAEALHISPAAVYSYGRGAIPRHYDTLHAWLKQHAVPEPLLAKLTNLYERDRTDRKTMPKGWQKQVAHISQSGFGPTLKTVIDGLGMNPMEFDARAMLECDDMLHTERWCRPAGGLPQNIHALVQVLGHFGATDEQKTSVLQAYYTEHEQLYSMKR